MKSEGFFYVSGYRREKTLKKQLTKTLTEALRTYKNSHRTHPNLQKLSKTLTGKATICQDLEKKLSKLSKNSQKLSLTRKCLKQSYLCLRRSLNKGTQMSRFRKTLKKLSKTLKKTAIFGQKLSKTLKKGAKLYIKLSKTSRGHWNFSDAILQPRNPRGHGVSKTT